VVHAEGRLHSPDYDSEGEDGLAYSSFEFFDDDAMCFWGICGPWSYNAWVEATNKYINEQLVVQYNKVFARAENHLQGAPLPQAMQDKFNKVMDAIKAWEEAGYKPNMTQLDKFAHPISLWWSSQIRAIIAHFDDAACSFDILNNIAEVDLNSPALAKGAPTRTLEPSPTASGSYLDGSGGPSNGKKGGSEGGVLGPALGIMALGGAAYFGFKVLTE